MSYPGLHVTPHIRLVRPLGRGGMSSVWVAEHLGLRTQVVVKFLSDALAQSPEMVARFQREAALASQVKSPHVVQMIDHGLAPNGVPYIAMELLEGRDLRQLLAARGPLAPHEVVAILWQVAKALGRAHERGVVHRDIKPDNIFLCDVGHGELFVKVLDFGIAKVGAASDLGATKTGVTLGTPYYMSPEQVMGAKVDARADVWSLGVVAYECLTGRRPFDEPTIGALSIAICQGEIAPPTRANRALPPGVDAWFQRACARAPAARFGTARELVDELARALHGASSATGVGAAAPAQPPVDTWPRGAPAGGSAPHLAAARPASQPAASAPALTTLGASATMHRASGAGRGSGRALLVLLLAGALAALGSVAFVLVARSGGAGAASSASADPPSGAAAAAMAPPVPAGPPAEVQPAAPSAPAEASPPVPSGPASAPGDTGAAAAPPPSASVAPGAASTAAPRPRAPAAAPGSTSRPPQKKKRDIDIR
ncbi:serine/threonine-protein kinase [Sorangium sp. So ce131]|uniref:serine/threonine-protein kinase n=1 Tax=Sorangium sp. So ce131 TaxID=3133282 RepID=UPI003F5DFCF5